MSTFTIRPSSNSEKEAFRVKLTATSLLSLKLRIGDIVLLKLANEEGGPPRPAIAWENSGTGMKDTIVQTSKLLQDLYGFKLGDRVSLVKSSEALKDIDTVVVKPLTTTQTEFSKDVCLRVLSLAAHHRYDTLTPSQKIVVKAMEQEQGEFEVIDVGEAPIGRLTQNTKFVTGEPPSLLSTTKIQLQRDDIGGLQEKLDDIQREIDLLLTSNVRIDFPGFENDHGLLLYGSKGVGKSLVMRKISESGWPTLITWSPGVKVSKPARYPQLIMVNLSMITGNNTFVEELKSLFESIKGTPTLIIGEARHPRNVDERLVTISTFSIRIELPVPNVDQRLDILTMLRGPSQAWSDDLLKDLASRTHGFVGADLRYLFRQICKVAHRRLSGQDSQQNQGDARKVVIAEEDIEASLPTVKPSALEEIFLEKPSVHWDDIGGQDALKRQLNSAVMRTYDPETRRRMTKLGLIASKGILLYGPPGCSKTLLVKALATETSVNFLAVKGPELISMYVGESERATREVFSRARAAAPCIIFFDEIDAMAVSRGRAASATSGLNMLTTLLTEMDGFEELRGVIVVAATNRPQDIDNALLRPGRFDNVIYVGLPDEQTRKEIIRKKLKNVSCGLGFAEEMDGYARLADGMSGAEVVAACSAALERVLDDNRDTVEAEDLKTAIETTARSVTKQMLREYETWNEARRRV